MHTTTQTKTHRRTHTQAHTKTETAKETETETTAETRDRDTDKYGSTVTARHRQTQIQTIGEHTHVTQHHTKQNMRGDVRT